MRFGYAVRQAEIRHQAEDTILSFNLLASTRSLSHSLALALSLSFGGAQLMAKCKDLFSTDKVYAQGP